MTLTATESKTLWDIGRFRTVAVRDLERFLYSRDAAKARCDLQALAEKGLVQRRTVLLNRRVGKLAVAVLTRAGKKELERRAETASAQAVYAGFVKPAEVAHDAAIYRMFHKEGAQILNEGGTIRRLVLDYELKRKVYSPLAKVRHLPPREYAKIQDQVARDNGLRVVNGKIPLPDLRIEYETAEGDMTRVDLELATHHYHGSHLQTKIEAGFKLYADGGGSSAKPLEERELSAEIFSL